MLKYRLMLGPLMLAAVAAVVYTDRWIEQAGGPAGVVMAGVFIVLILLGGRELAGLFRLKGWACDTWVVSLSGLAGCLAMMGLPLVDESVSAGAMLASVAAVMFLVSMISHCRRRTCEGVIGAAGLTAAAFIYLGLLPGFYLAIRCEHDAWVVAAVILVIKCGDIGAYFTGRAIGRTKLIAWLSPGKTWEGLGGAVLLSAVVAAGLVAWCDAQGTAFQSAARELIGQRYIERKSLFRVDEHRSQIAFSVPRAAIDDQSSAVLLTPPDEWPTAGATLPLWYAALAGAVLAVTGHAGDLIASAIKRDAQVKDAGTSIPGFGGMLDVFDSALLGAPAAYWLLKLGGCIFQ